jgi:hypothetical protein
MSATDGQRGKMDTGIIKANYRHKKTPKIGKHNKSIVSGAPCIVLTVLVLWLQMLARGRSGLVRGFTRGKVGVLICYPLHNLGNSSGPGCLAKQYLPTVPLVQADLVDYSCTMAAMKKTFTNVYQPIGKTGHRIYILSYT